MLTNLTAVLLCQNAGHVFSMQPDFKDSRFTNSGLLVQQASEYNGLLLTDKGEVLPLGSNGAQYQLRIPQERAYKYVSGNTRFGAAIDEFGDLHYWWGSLAGLDQPTETLSGLPLDTYRVEQGPFAKVDADDRCLIAMREDGTLFFFDDEDQDLDLPTAIQVIDCDIEAYVSGGDSGIHGALITTAGEVITFGYGPRAEESGFFNGPQGDGFTSLAITERFGFALRQDGTVWKWAGFNSEAPNPISGSYRSIREHEDSTDAAGIRSNGTVDWRLDEEPGPNCTTCPSESEVVLEIATYGGYQVIMSPDQNQFQANDSDLQTIISQTKPHDIISLDPGTYAYEYDGDSEWTNTLIGAGIDETVIEFTNNCYPFTIKNATVVFKSGITDPGPYDRFSIQRSLFENCKIINELPSGMNVIVSDYVEFDNCQFTNWGPSSSFYDGHIIYSNCSAIENLPGCALDSVEYAYPRRCLVFKNCASETFLTTSPESGLITILTGDIVNLPGTTLRNAEGVLGSFIHVRKRGNLQSEETGSLIRSGKFENGNAVYGGAVYSKNPIQIVGSTFISNSASHGGAVYMTEQMSLSNKSDLIECSFLNNTSDDGACIKSAQQYVNVDQCYFSGHESAMFGSIKSVFLVADSIFCENSSSSLQDEYDVVDLGNNVFDPNCQTFDCNSNGILDIDELATGEGLDCNANGVLDDCDIASSFESDCNSNQIPDSCEIADGLLDDCDTDGVPDVCTILDSPSQDSNNDGILDRCQCITDINGDGFTDFSDVLQLLSCWGSDPTGVCGFADVSDDGIIDFSDVLLMLNDFGPC